MNITQKNTDQELIERINASDEKAFKILYDLYWEQLFISAFNLVKLRDVSEDILQEIFIKIWTNRGEIQINTSLKGYLYTCVLYKTYDYFRKNKDVFKEDFLDNFNKRIQTSNPESKLIHKELISHINKSVDSLPEKTKVVFKLSRESQLSHKEIAKELNISTKTVEAHITKALKILKISISNIASIELIVFLFEISLSNI